MTSGAQARLRRLARAPVVGPAAALCACAASLLPCPSPSAGATGAAGSGAAAAPAPSFTPAPSPTAVPAPSPVPAYRPGQPAAGAGQATGHGFRLRRERGQGWVLEDMRFTARIAEDGTVTFSDEHGAVGLLLPVPLPLPEGTPTVQGSLRGLGRRKAPRDPVPGPAPTPVPVPHMSPYRPDPAEICTYPHPCFFDAAVTFIAAGGTFDASDEIMRLGKNDPYRDLKAQFLASTAELRQELGRRARDRARAQALDALRARLDAIGRDRSRSVAERQATMRALADDLDPDPAVSGPARALIDARVRALATAPGAAR